MRRSIRCQAFKWQERKTRAVKEITPVIAYEAGYRAAMADMTGQQFKRIPKQMELLT